MHTKGSLIRRKLGTVIEILCCHKKPLLHTCRAFEDEKKAKMGVVECAKHELVEPFNVLWEREGM